MDLHFRTDLAAGYQSQTQRIRVLSEEWLHRTMYCPGCTSPALARTPNNNPAGDFACLGCGEQFELKSKSGAIGRTISDGAYRTMMDRLASDKNPSLFLISYERSSLAVRSLTVVPKHFFTAATIQQRSPLAPTARRAGWVGCNILVGAIPNAGRVIIVSDGVVRQPAAVRDDWKAMMFLRREAKAASRRWLIETINCIEQLGRSEFRLSDIYRFEPRLRELFPANHHIRAKLRQQLQRLRDAKVLEFQGNGNYRKLPGSG